jgi:hypothetical protein
VNERLRNALHRKIGAHNRLVWITSIWGVTGAVAMWVAIYFLVYWLAVVFASVAKGLDAESPQHIGRIFGIVAAVLLIGGGIARRLGFHRQLHDERGFGMVLLEVAIIPARVTFAAVQNFRNHVRLNEDELIAATDLLVRIVRAGKIADTAMPQDLPDDAQREHVLYVLQLLDLIYLRQTDQGIFYSVADPQRLVPFLQPKSQPAS